MKYYTVSNIINLEDSSSTNSSSYQIMRNMIKLKSIKKSKNVISKCVLFNIFNIL